MRSSIREKMRFWARLLAFTVGLATVLHCVNAAEAGSLDKEGTVAACLRASVELPLTIVHEKRWVPNVNGAPGDRYVSVDVLRDASGREIAVVQSGISTSWLRMIVTPESPWEDPQAPGGLATPGETATTPGTIATPGKIMDLP